MSSFKFIYESYYKKIFNYLKSYSLTNEDCHDLTQEVFYKYYCQLEKKIYIENVNAWLHKCATNMALNKIKKKKTLLIDDQPLSKTYAINFNLEKEIIKNETEKLVNKILNQLKPAEKSLVLLYRKGFSYREISEILGIKYTSVGKTLTRSIEKLSLELKKLNNESMLHKGDIA